MLRFDGEKTISLIWLLMKKDKKKSLLFGAYFYARSEIGKNDISILRRRSTNVYLTRNHEDITPQFTGTVAFYHRLIYGKIG